MSFIGLSYSTTFPGSKRNPLISIWTMEVYAAALFFLIEHPRLLHIIILEKKKKGIRTHTKTPHTPTRYHVTFMPLGNNITASLS
jgi:hypothetical protein